MEATLIETKKGNGFKVIVEGKWLYTSKKEFFRAIKAKHGCVFREIEEENKE